jgi:hypothetical protein
MPWPSPREGITASVVSGFDDKQSLHAGCTQGVTVRRSETRNPNQTIASIRRTQGRLYGLRGRVT